MLFDIIEVLALQHLFPKMKLRKGFKTSITGAMLCNVAASVVAASLILMRTIF